MGTKSLQHSKPNTGTWIWTRNVLKLFVYVIPRFPYNMVRLLSILLTVPGRARILNLSRRSSSRWLHSCLIHSFLQGQGSVFPVEESSVRRHFLPVLRLPHNSYVLASRCHLFSFPVPPSWWEEGQTSSLQQIQCFLWQGGSYRLWLGLKNMRQVDADDCSCGVRWYFCWVYRRGCTGWWSLRSFWLWFLLSFWLVSFLFLPLLALWCLPNTFVRVR